MPEEEQEEQRKEEAHHKDEVDGSVVVIGDASVYSLTECIWRAQFGTNMPF